MIDLRLDKMSYPDLMKLAKTENRQVLVEVKRRLEEGDRPKVRGFKKYDKLSELQQKILRLFTSAMVGDTYVKNTESVYLNFAKHTTHGGWVSWLTISRENEFPDLLAKITRLKGIVEEEKEHSGLCRIYLIPVRNKKDGWEGFKVRLDRGTRLVYEDV